MVFSVILSIQTDIYDFFEPLLDAFSDAYDMIMHFLLKFMDPETLKVFFVALGILALILVVMAIINKNN